MTNIYDRYKSDSYFQIEISLLKNYYAVVGNNCRLIIKWNVFKDKKNNSMPVMRARYILFDESNNRLSLKELNLKVPVEFKQIYIGEFVEEVIDVINDYNMREMFIFAQFGDWINTTFKKMIESGDYKITAMKSLK